MPSFSLWNGDSGEEGLGGSLLMQGLALGLAVLATASLLRCRSQGMGGQGKEP